jgi:hypothetical protein
MPPVQPVVVGINGAILVAVRLSAHSLEVEMAVGVQLDFRGATLEQYDLTAESLGLLPGGPAAPDQLFHWVTKTDNGIRCLDVWESREAFEEFWETRVRPVLPEIGVVDPPEIQYFEVHNYFAGRRKRG